MKFVKVLLWSMIVTFPFVVCSGWTTSELMRVASRTNDNLSHQVAFREPTQ